MIEKRVRDRIAGDLARVSGWIGGLRRAARPEELEAGGDNTPLSEAADAAQVVEEREVNIQLLDWLVERSVDLRRALRRLDEGIYGICERCDEFIHPERLHALPEAALCLKCQTEVERARQAHRAIAPAWIEAALSYRRGGGGGAE
jgi:RNA polymerase-binding transcription factor DksA